MFPARLKTQRLAMPPLGSVYRTEESINHGMIIIIFFTLTGRRIIVCLALHSGVLGLEYLTVEPVNGSETVASYMLPLGIIV
jgi:hypothetical protein